MNIICLPFVNIVLRRFQILIINSLVRWSKNWASCVLCCCFCLAKKRWNLQSKEHSPKHAGGITIIQNFSASETGSLVKVDGIMKKEDHIQILDQNIKQSSGKFWLEHQWTFQEDSDPKHVKLCEDMAHGQECQCFRVKKPEPRH